MFGLYISVGLGPTNRNTHLEQGDQILIVVLELGPPLCQWWHEDIHEGWVLEGWPNRVGQSPHGVVKDQHVLVLILFECENQVSKDWFEEWNELVACVLLKSGKSAATSLLYTFVVVEDHPEQLRTIYSAQEKGRGTRNTPPPESAQRTVVCAPLKRAEYTSQHNGRGSSKRSTGRGAGRRKSNPGNRQPNGADDEKYLLIIKGAK